MTELVDTAIYKEIVSQAFCIAGQSKTRDPCARALMKELAQEELGHEEWLKALKGKGVEKLNWHRERVHKVEYEADYDPTNKALAFTKAQEWGNRIPIGVIYREERSTFEEQLPALSKGPLVM